MPTQMFPPLPARATFVADTNFVSGTQKMFLTLFRNILCPQQMFSSLRRLRNIMGNNVSSFTRAFTQPSHNGTALVYENHYDIFLRPSTRVEIFFISYFLYDSKRVWQREQYKNYRNGLYKIQ